LYVGGFGHTVHAATETETPSVVEQQLRAEIEMLKQRLEQLESALHSQPPAAASASDAELERMDQQIRILQRQRELDMEEAEAKKASAPKLNAGAGGFSIASPNDDFQLKLRGYLQADARFYFDDDADELDDTFTLRRVRPILEGTVWDDYYFRIMPDFGGGSTELYDAYMDFLHFPMAKLRVGKFKTPFGLERLQSATNLMFVERGFPTSLAPNRDVGIELYGDWLESRLSYELGVFNGVPDGANADVDIGDGKELAARLFSHPFAKSELEPLQGLGVGVAATFGDTEGTVSSVRSSARQRIFQYAAGTSANGEHWRISPQGYYYWGPFGMMGEYVLSSQELERNGEIRDFDNDAWQIQASWVLTGEQASYKGVKPSQPFNPSAGNWGAFELAARYGNLDLDDDIFQLGFADRTASVDEADEYSLGLKWYLNNNVLYMIDYVHTDFSGGRSGRDRESEDALLSRFQISF
jgi:phosphate-selective porin OprO/OprP